MYEELIKRLRRCSQFRCRECEYEQVVGCRAKLNAEAADAIEDLSKPKWIPVTERLPEKEKKSYLCRTDGGYHCEVRWTDNIYGLCTGGGGRWGWSIFDIPQYAKVTHWMQLPEPPKEE